MPQVKRSQRPECLNVHVKRSWKNLWDVLRLPGRMLPNRLAHVTSTRNCLQEFLRNWLKLSVHRVLPRRLRYVSCLPQGPSYPRNMDRDCFPARCTSRGMARQPSRDLGWPWWRSSDYEDGHCSSRLRHRSHSTHCLFHNTPAGFPPSPAPYVPIGGKAIGILITTTSGN